MLCAKFALCGGVIGQIALVSSHAGSGPKHLDYSGVVVWLEPMTRVPVLPAHPRHAQMIQKNKKFVPHVLPLLVGTVVDFPNYDPIFHNAFSNYEGQTFDVGLYPPGSSRSVTFRREGIVRVFCNIHAAMSAVIVVLKSPYFGVSDKTGVYEISGVPPGEYQLHIFHERSTAETLRSLTRPVEVGDGPVKLPLISVSESGYLPMPHKNKYGQDYPRPNERGAYPGETP